MTRLFWFAVTGRGSFPFHMLGVSQAWPLNNNAAAGIELSCPTVAPEVSLILASHRQPTRKDYEMWQHSKWPITGGGCAS